MTQQRMDISGELIDKFFNRACTEEEAIAVSDYLYENPHLLEAYFDQEWTEELRDPLTEEESDELLQAIRSRSVIRTVRMRRWKTATFAVAAAVLLIVCGSVWWRTVWNGNGEDQVAATEQVQWESRKNTFGRLMQLRLQEDAVAQLQPASEIRFRRQADGKVHEVHMSGDIHFQVAGDRLRAFTVYAGNVATTVLGTEFRVKEDSVSVTVTLFEGKVVVKPVAVTSKWQEAIYLKPGETLVFNKRSQSVKVTGRSGTNLHRRQIVEEDTIDLAPVNITDKGYSFRNQPLRDVFATLEQIYGVQIEYKPVDINNVYFIGSFEKTDSIETILNNIALLKKLQIQHKGDTYIISGKSH